MSRLLTVDETAKYLKVSPYTVRKWLRTGKLRGHKIGRLYRVVEDDLLYIGSTGVSKNKLKEADVIDMFADAGRPWDEITTKEKQLRLARIVGKYADIPLSSDDLQLERQEEIELEERKFRGPRG